MRRTLQAEAVPDAVDDAGHARILAAEGSRQAYRLQQGGGLPVERAVPTGVKAVSKSKATVLFPTERTVAKTRSKCKASMPSAGSNAAPAERDGQHLPDAAPGLRHRKTVGFRSPTVSPSKSLRDSDGESSPKSASGAFSIERGPAQLYKDIKKCQTANALMALINDFADQCQQLCKNARLPLHHALHHGVSQEVVLQLLDANPAAAKEADKAGCLPLNYKTVLSKYAKDGANEVALRLLELNPAAARCDDKGMLPLHCALREGASEPVVDKLLSIHRKAAEEPDRDGNFPLQHAIQHAHSERIISCLLDCSHEAVRNAIADDRGSPQGKGAKADNRSAIQNALQSALETWLTRKREEPISSDDAIFKRLIESDPTAVKGMDEGTTKSASPSIKAVLAGLELLMQPLRKEPPLLESLLGRPFLQLCLGSTLSPSEKISRRRFQDLADDVSSSADEALLAYVAALHCSSTFDQEEVLKSTLGVIERLLGYARLLHASEPSRADRTLALANRLQLIAAEHLRIMSRMYSPHPSRSVLTRGNDELDGMLRRHLPVAIRCEAKVFIMQQTVRWVVQRRRLGPVLFEWWTFGLKQTVYAWSNEDYAALPNRYRFEKSEDKTNDVNAEWKVDVVFEFFVLLFVFNVLLGPLLLLLTALYPPLAQSIEAVAKASKTGQLTAQSTNEPTSEVSTEVAAARVSTSGTQKSLTDSAELLAREVSRVPRVPGFRNLWLPKNVAGNLELYLLGTPVAKFILASLSDSVLALFLTLPPISTLANPHVGMPLLSWVCASALFELRQLMAGVKAYWYERFNRLDAPALLATIAALVSILTHNGDGDGDGDTNATALSSNARSLRAIAATLLWLRTMRVLLAFSTTGPYTLMIFTMFRDIAKFIAFLVCVVLAFAAAFFTLFESVTHHELAYPAFVGTQPDCTAFFSSYASTLVFLTESSLTGGDFFECVRNSSTTPTTGWFLYVVYYVLTALLLLNMLIAMMTKSFDKIDEASAMNYIFQLTQMTWSLDAMPNASLYALTIPYDAVQILRKMLKRMVQFFCGGRRLGDEAAAERSRQRGRRRPALMRPGQHAMAIQKLRDNFERYVGENQDEIAQEERWRTTMKKDFNQGLDTLERRQMEQLKKLEAQLERHMQQQSEQLDKVMQALPASSSSTASPLEAQLEEHARQQRGQIETLMKTLPASFAHTVPIGTTLLAKPAKDLSPSLPSKVVATILKL